MNKNKKNSRSCDNSQQDVANDEYNVRANGTEQSLVVNAESVMQVFGAKSAPITSSSIHATNNSSNSEDDENTTLNPKRKTKIKHKVLRSTDILFAMAATYQGFKKYQASKMADSRRYKNKLELILTRLVGEGKLLRLPGQLYTLSDTLDEVRGVLSIQRQGQGFVTVASEKNDIYIHQSRLAGAWSGDEVLVTLMPGRYGKNKEGRIKRVLRRSKSEIIVSLLPELVKERCDNSKGSKEIVKQVARPVDHGAPGYVIVNLSELKEKPSSGDTLLVRLLEEEFPDNIPRADALDFIDANAGIPLFERMVKASHGISTEFPINVLDECKALPHMPDVRKELDETANKRFKRLDLRELDFVTIDGSDAKDFDDAIYVNEREGVTTLFVAIADVANYVKNGSALDTEALARGNSCYFPASVEPMLPEALSNGLCSLKPDEPRLTMISEMIMNENGSIKESRCYPAVIESKARLTYELVEALIEGEEIGGGKVDEIISSAKLSVSKERLASLLPMLKLAEKLAIKMMILRAKNGSLDFDLPESIAKVDQNKELVGLGFRERLFSHRLIEHFMVNANEAVARFLERSASKGLSFLYRIHPAPDEDKLENLATNLAASGFSLPNKDKMTPSALQDILHEVKGKPEEFVVNRLLLRSMMQAKYSPENQGHFGLASQSYAHFTSPIRRYADLIVHRVLRHVLGSDDLQPSEAHLAEIADSINLSERNAIEAERDIYKICSAIYLSRQPDEDYDGIVSGMNSYGVFVELRNIPAEGFIAIEDLPKDEYFYDQKKNLLLGMHGGYVFRLGQSIRVRVDIADPVRLVIRFKPSDDAMFVTERGGAAGRMRSDAKKKVTENKKRFSFRGRTSDTSDKRDQRGKPDKRGKRDQTGKRGRS